MYCPGFVLDLEGAVDLSRLEFSFRSVIARHAALRSALAGLHADEPLQVVFASSSFRFEVT